MASSIWSTIIVALHEHFQSNSFSKEEANNFVLDAEINKGKPIHHSSWKAMIENNALIVLGKDNYQINPDFNDLPSEWVLEHTKPFVSTDETISGTAVFFSKEDIKIINDEYFIWKEQGLRYIHMGFRRSNAPEIISEGLCCALFNWGRTNNIEKLEGVKETSFDAIDPNTGELIQIKAISTRGNDDEGGPSSFGPKTVFNKLVFIHINTEEDTAKFYDFNVDEYKQLPVSSTETVADWQKKGKRPHVLILPVIKERNLQPFYTYKFEKGE